MSEFKRLEQTINFVISKKIDTIKIVKMYDIKNSNILNDNSDNIITPNFKKEKHERRKD
jgi:hypothetical protein